MAEIYLVRHGQASFGTDNYDKLSPLGHKQANWLGEYFQERGISFDCVIAGSLVRQQETAQGIVQQLNNTTSIETLPALNEFTFREIINAYVEKYPEKMPNTFADAKVYFGLLKSAMLELLEEKLDEKSHLLWQNFEDNITNAVTYIKQLSKNHQKILVVSSGGSMSLMMRNILGLDNKQMLHLNLNIKNTSLSQFYSNGEAIRLNSFNHAPHLDTPERLEAITYS